MPTAGQANLILHGCRYFIGLLGVISEISDLRAGLAPALFTIFWDCEHLARTHSRNTNDDFVYFCNFIKYMRECSALVERLCM